MAAGSKVSSAKIVTEQECSSSCECRLGWKGSPRVESPLG